MNILLLGGGAREASLARVISKSKLTDTLYVSPGNPGMEDWGVNVNLDGFDKISDFCNKNNIEILVVGPEQPLVDGIADYCKEHNPGLIVVGPNKKGAELEGSKEFAKDFMTRHKIPTARYRSFNREQIDQAKEFLSTLKAPYVLKADGLAAGKGVLIAQSLKEAEQELDEMLLKGKFGNASAKVVIEEFLTGIECSVFVLTDSENYIVLPQAKDYKKIGEGDTGLNTGGMGSISPVPFCDKAFMDKVEKQIIVPTIEGLKKEEIEYKGFIFFGLMNCEGNPYVIEYNVRMGDPESESVFARVESDIVESFKLLGTKQLNLYKPQYSQKTAATVMLCSGGYPESYEKGKVIEGLDKTEDTIVYHAGTKSSDKGELLSNGGRVIALTCLGDDMNSALQKVYKNVEKVHFEKMYFRRDIGKDLM